jgi:hypothetical protein
LKEDDSVNAKVAFGTMTLLVLGVIAAYGADVTGRWVAQFPNQRGQTQERTFDFKAEGGKLTGTTSSPLGEQTITDGTISGDDISFVVVAQGGQAGRKMLFKGKIAGNEIKFTRTTEGGMGGRGGRGRGAPATMEFVAKKVG